jgi:hypothetical protein
LACAAAATILPCEAQAAWDNAAQAAYADGWQTGDNGGSGFLPWSLSYSGIAPANHSDHFIDNGPLAANSLGAPAFGMTNSGRAFFSDTSTSNRPFADALTVGQTFSVDVDGAGFSNGDPNPFSKGNVITLRNGAAAERFGIFTNNGLNSDTWTVTNPAGVGSGVSTGIAAASAFHVAFTLTGPETYDLVLSPVGGGAPLFQQLGATLRTATTGTAISLVRFSEYGTGNSVNGVSELFFNNLSIVPEPASVALVLIGAFGVLATGRRGR